MQQTIEFGLIGNKLGHSYSPEIHSYLKTGDYQLLPSTEKEMVQRVESRSYVGLNITVPYKAAVMPLLDAINEEALAIGAVNTIVNHKGWLIGYNTDVDGFAYTMEKYQISVKGKKVIVLGNGGVSKPTIYYLKKSGVKEIITVKHKEEAGVISYQEAASHHADAALIINTSPVGMFPLVDQSPIELVPYNKLECVVDLIANPIKTKLMFDAEKMGIKAVGGLEMLLIQAVRASELFNGTEISRDIVEDLYTHIRDKMENPIL